MTGATFTALVRKYTKTNSTTLSNSDILTYLNVEKDDIAEKVVANVDEGYFDMEDVRNLEANVRNYTYPEDLLKSIRYVAAKLDGTNWSYLREIDFGYFEGRNMPLMENSHIKNEFAGKEPRYLIYGTQIYLLTGDDIQAVTDGLKVVLEVYPEDYVEADLSDSADLSVPSATNVVRLPRATHKVLAKKVSIAYKSSKDKPLPLTEDEKKVEIDLEDLYDKLRGRNAVRVITGKVPYNDGQNY